MNSSTSREQGPMSYGQGENTPDSFEVTVPLHRAVPIVYAGERCVVMPIGEGAAGNNVIADPSGSGLMLVTQTSRQGLANVLVQDSKRKGIPLGINGADKSRHPVRGILLFIGGAVVALVASNVLHLPVAADERDSSTMPIATSSGIVPPSTAPKASADISPSTEPTNPQPSPNTPSTAAATDSVEHVIILDPGHSGSTKKIYDKKTATSGPKTGLKDTTYYNPHETEENWDVAQMVKKRLEAQGYKVVLTKKSAKDTVTNRQRSDVAKKYYGELFVPIHNDHGQSPKKFSEVWAPKVGQYRITPDGRKITFESPLIACESKAYAEIMAKTRSEAQGVDVVLGAANFNNRGKDIAKGNIPLVSLFMGDEALDDGGDVGTPVVYNETGANYGKNTPMPDDAKERYALGLSNGIIESMNHQQQIKAKCGDA